MRDSSGTAASGLISTSCPVRPFDVKMQQMPHCFQRQAVAAAAQRVITAARFQREITATRARIFAVRRQTLARPLLQTVRSRLSAARARSNENRRAPLRRQSRQFRASDSMTRSARSTQALVIRSRLQAREQSADCCEQRRPGSRCHAAPPSTSSFDPFVENLRAAARRISPPVISICNAEPPPRSRKPTVCPANLARRWR